MRKYDTSRPSGAPFELPMHPPREWFDAPTWLEPGEDWVITDEGRVGGYLYDTGLRSIHVAAPGPLGWAPKSSPTGFAYFHGSGRVVCDDGSSIEVGWVAPGHPVLPSKGDRKASLPLLAREAQSFYDDPSARCAAVRVGIDDRGICWVAGTVVQQPRLTFGGLSGITVDNVATMRAAGLSGHWVPMAADWWTAHGHQASLATTGMELAGIGLVGIRALPLAKPPARAALDETSGSGANRSAAALRSADAARSAAADRVATAQERLAASVRAVSSAMLRDTPEQLVRAAALDGATRRVLRGRRVRRAAIGGLALDQPRAVRLLTAQKRVQRDTDALRAALLDLIDADVDGAFELAAVLPVPALNERI